MTDTLTEAPTAQQFADGLRAMADHIEANPVLAGHGDFAGCYVTVMSFARDAADFGARVAALGPSTKGSDDHDLEAVRSFGQRVRFCVTVPKSETCERRVVGTRQVQREVYPDDVQPTIELVDEEIVEWICPPSFLALAEGGE